MLSSLALTSQFLRKLWFIITTKEQQSIFGNSATYVNIISRGIELSPNDVQKIVPLFTTFCSLLMLLIATLHDNEFYNDDPSKNYSIFIFISYAIFSSLSLRSRPRKNLPDAIHPSRNVTHQQRRQRIMRRTCRISVSGLPTRFENRRTT